MCVFKCAHVETKGSYQMSVCLTHLIYIALFQIVYMSLCMDVHVSIDTHRSQRRASDLLELELQEVVVT